jgi:hypothetical protein
MAYTSLGVGLVGGEGEGERRRVRSEERESRGWRGGRKEEKGKECFRTNPLSSSF